MDVNMKLSYFDYFLSSLLAYSASPEDISLEEKVKSQYAKGKTISKLKAFKLLFFAVAIDSQNWTLLDKVFDNFYALPYGPVESDIYDNIGSLTNYELCGNNLILKAITDFSYSNCNEDYLKTISQAVEKLGNLYPSLFSMSAIDLVELSHRSDCWKIAINQANAIGSSSGRMSHDLIKQSRVYFY